MITPVDERRIRWKTNLFLLAILFYLVGPTTFRLANAYLADFLFAGFFMYALITGTRPRIRHPIVLTFLLPFIIVLISHLGKLWSDFPLGVDEFANSVKTLQLFVLVSFSIGIFDARMSNDYFEKVLKKFSIVISVAVLYNGLIGVFQYFEIAGINKFLETFYYIELNLVDMEGVSNVDVIAVENRITGIFESWNGVGFFLSQTLFILFLIRNEQKSKLDLPAIFIGISALILAGSRAALIGFIIAWVVYSLYILHSKKTVTAIISLTLISVPLVLIMRAFDILPEDNIQRFVELYDFVTTGELPASWAFRLDTWSWMPQHILSSPYFLFGYPNQVWKMSIYFWGADSQYVAWLLVYGLFGLILFMLWSLLVIVMFFKEYSSLRRIAKDFVVTRFHGAFVIIFFSYLIIGISQDSMLANRWREIFLAFIGFMVSWGIRIKRLAEEKERPATV